HPRPSAADVSQKLNRPAPRVATYLRHATLDKVYIDRYHEQGVRSGGRVVVHRATCGWGLRCARGLGGVVCVALQDLRWLPGAIALRTAPRRGRRVARIAAVVAVEHEGGWR